VSRIACATAGAIVVHTQDRHPEVTRTSPIMVVHGPFTVSPVQGFTVRSFESCYQQRSRLDALLRQVC